MKLKRDILGVILSFTLTGIIGTNVDAKAYEQVYKEHNKQEQRMKKAIQSEFISNNDKKELEQGLDELYGVKETGTRRTIRKVIEAETKELSTIDNRLKKAEKKVAKAEFIVLKNDINQLQKKADEVYVVKTDIENIKKLTADWTLLPNAEKVGLIRLLTKKTSKVYDQTQKNQEELTGLIKELEQVNKLTQELSKKKYVLSQETKELRDVQAINSTFIDNADSIDATKTQLDLAKKAYQTINDNQMKTEQDFRDFKDKSDVLVDASNSLIRQGLLTLEDKSELEDKQQKLVNSLNLTDYLPGDLEKSFQSLQPTYDDLIVKNNQKKLEESRTNSHKMDTSNQQSSPTLLGDWYQAPPGCKFLKSDSGKTYGQVKNPNNFTLITTEEASNYTPGRGNGSAKQ
ncbi:MAG: hypothetical protein ACTJHC_09430 [Vagococcus sp.]